MSNKRRDKPPSPLAAAWQQFASLLAMRVSGASLAVFRICVGVVMTLEAYSLCVPNRAAIASGKSPLQNYYTGPDVTFHFPYAGFEWLPLLPAPWIYALVGIMGLAGITMALGLCYRLSATTVFVIWTYLWVVESTRSYWQSHYYLEVLLTFLMIWMPAARRFSLDAWLSLRGGRAEAIPFWPIFLLRGQLLIAYFYAGVAKLNQDWLLDAVPVRWFLADPQVSKPFEPYLTAGQLATFESVIRSTEFAYFISYAGAAFDLAVGFLLLFRRTRLFALVLMAIFHTTNALIIFDDIGWFPLVGFTTALIFLNPDWPERLWKWLRHPRIRKPDWGWLAAGGLLFPIVGAALGWSLPAASPKEQKGRNPRIRRTVAPLLVVWLTWQAVLPIRHYLIEGDGRFTYEGMSFSWRLKADVRQGQPHQLYIADPQIISIDKTSGEPHIDWHEWHGDKVVYRALSPQRVDWSSLPEIVVLLQPLTGERIIYNPYSRYVGPPRTEHQSRKRLNDLWQEIYARKPQVEPTRSLAETVEEMVEAFGRSEAAVPESEELAPLLLQLRRIEQGDLAPSEAAPVRLRLMEVFTQLNSRESTAAVIRPSLRKLEPLALYGARPMELPFLAIEDPHLLTLQDARFKVDRSAWKNERYRVDQRDPLVVHLGTVDVDTWQMLPQAFITDFADHPERPPMIRWNSGKDLNVSKLMHTSIQPFYLQRYAVRVARLWYEEYGRRPAVHALTSMGLNGRPRQLLVDPGVDLASVRVNWFSHNTWIRDLETPRIPRGSLDR